MGMSEELDSEQLLLKEKVLGIGRTGCWIG